MTLKEKIAQLMIIRVSSMGDAAENQQLVEKITEFQPGGVCFFKGEPVREAAITNRIQAVSKIPMFISIDGEWGPAMRLDSCVAFPRQMTLGAITKNNDALIYQMGLEVARQCKAVGINTNFAPCVDINNNSKNPVINSRSFGENRELVTEKARLYLHGMQDGGIIGCLKHFPGHGDTETDSHLGLPTIHKTKNELDELELYPYKQLIDNNIGMIMVGHLNIPSLDTSNQSVSSLSYPIVTSLLKEELGYKGLIITDGMEMAGVDKQNTFEGDVDIRALIAGVDILLLPGNLEKLIPAMVTAVDSGLLSIDIINDRCKRILEFKEQKGLLHYDSVELSGIHALLNSNNANNLNNKLEQKAITLIKNDHHYLPLSCLLEENDTLPSDSIAILCIGRPEYQSEYLSLIKQYQLAYFYHNKSLHDKEYSTLMNQLLPYKSIIVAYGGSNQLAGSNYGADSKIIGFLNDLAAQKDVVLIHMGNPYVLNFFGPLDHYKSILVTYQSTPNTFASSLQACFGTMRCEGKLPVSINGYSSNFGLSNNYKNQNYSALSDTLTAEIDSILINGIKKQIYPGCVVLATKDGKTIYNKSFGHYTYIPNQPVTQNTLYDIASVTKVAATTLAVMKLYDEQKLHLNDHIRHYLPYLEGTNKAHISILELLTHTSGLVPFIPFYQKIKNNDNILKHYKSDDYSIKIADNLYLRNDYLDTMRQIIAHSKLGSKKYVYSDLNFLFLKEIVENITGQSLEDYLTDNFYHPMGLTHTCFRPLDNNFTETEIAPTENDTSFRKQLIQGYVHDETAALFNGNGGNAGLFTTAKELESIFRMLLQNGMYDGVQYLSPETVRLFTSAYEMHDCEIRGLGFHTPKHPGSSSIVPNAASNRIFGHQGFTGTVVWCDPDNQLIFVFLSNRVHPSREPNKLSKSRIRLIVHELIYKEAK